MLLKNCLRTRNLIVTHRTFGVQYHKFHMLSSRPLIYPANVTVSHSNFSHVIYRYESSNAAPKDKILNLSSTDVNSVPPVPSSTVPSSSDILPDIPVPVSEPVVETVSTDLPEIVAEAVVPLNALGEPTLQALGLGSYYTPVGWLQNILEYVHVTFDAPWWIVISSCVLVTRLALFPLVVKQQRDSIKTQNVMPEMNALQEKMQQAKAFGNHVETMKAGMELARFMEEKKINPTKAMVFPMIQAPIFLSFFWGLRSMANTPVESFATGGFLWLKDLTVYDPYYVLPSVTCLTLFATISCGAEFGTRMPTASPLGKYFPLIMKCIPIFVFPFIMHFPSAICVYWGSNNLMSLMQVLFLKLPKVRKYFNIEKTVSPNIPQKPLIHKGIIKDIKNSFSTVRIAREIEERERLDEMNFRRAGRAPPTKTFKNNPLIKEALKN